MVAANAMEIFALLNKSNCKKCGEKTCLAFAGSVFTGKCRIDECPDLAEESKARFRGEKESADDALMGEDWQGQLLDELAGMDLEAAAERTGGQVRDGFLYLKVLGKEFGVDNRGNCSTLIHVNPWVQIPLLTYVVRGKGVIPTGNWISFREIAGGRERAPLFSKRSEEDLGRLADVYPSFFADIVQMFDAAEVEQMFAADVSVILYPLPRVPIMLCHWRAEDGIASSLNLFFDETVDANLGPDGLYTLCAGLVSMFTKLAEQHGF